MKEVHKKSIDPAVNKTLMEAYRRHIPLIWDRAEALQPQCGFGRLSICCSDCQEGPCRVNPFSNTDQQTICGRGKHDLVTGDLLRRAADGAIALAKLAIQSGEGTGGELIRKLVVAADEMVASPSAAERLATIGECSLAALESVRRWQEKVCDIEQPAAVEVNLGVLQADAVNIVFHGHVDLKVVAGLKAAARNSGLPVKYVAMCGNELSGGFRLPVLTNYDSQEVPLLSGVIDLLVVGSQCIMPSLLALADRLDVPAARAAMLGDAADCEGAIVTACRHYRRRENTEFAIPAVKGEAYSGYTAKNSALLFQSLAAEYAHGKLKGVIYLGGCGTVANTQDAQPVKLAEALINAGFLVITAGCVGTALAKAGMCHPGWKNGAYALSGVLPPDTPPVLHIGACHDAGVLLQIAEALQHRVPLFAVFAEINHNKVLATAIGFAIAGISTWLGYEPLLADDVVSGWLNEKLSAQAGARVFPLTDTARLLQDLIETATGRAGTVRICI